VRTDTFKYTLDPELIAQEPLRERDGARLMVLRGHHDAAPEHSKVRELARLLPSDALVVVNDSRVLPARIFGTKIPSGGSVEIFLIRPEPSGKWRALGRASKPLRPGQKILAAPLTIEVLEKHEDGSLTVATDGGADERAILRAIGHIPLPPYIKRSDLESDRERYQTVFAQHEGSVAAPTAGLHFTHALMTETEARGCTFASITLHVGLGTFQPVTVSDLDTHPMHSEMYEISQSTALAVTKAKREGRKIVAVGTTVVRALESAAALHLHEHALQPVLGETKLLIQPGYAFKVVDFLLTNFHLPESTLLSLVCAFGGTERVLAAYEEATRERYRFFSYGDAMFVERS
jgi:S-adenosylmethionine:tRNA ribosyltransferase-isomerase